MQKVLPAKRAAIEAFIDRRDRPGFTDVNDPSPIGYVTLVADVLSFRLIFKRFSPVLSARFGGLIRDLLTVVATQRRRR